MTSGSSPAIRVGITATPEIVHAAVRIGDDIVSSHTGPAGQRAEIMNEVIATAGRSPDMVVVDLSHVLRDAVVRTNTTLPPVAVVRIVPRPATDPVLARSPADLVERIVSRRLSVRGGHDILGHELHQLDLASVSLLCDSLSGGPEQHVAIVSPGSQASAQHELAVADAVQAALPSARISVASDFGGQGLVAREATVVLDCALGDLLEAEMGGWQRDLDDVGGSTMLRVARCDGGYSLASRARAAPSMALGASDALMLAGAAHLAGLTDCRVRLPRADGPMAGEVRHGLASVRPAELADLGTELVIPTALLAPDREEGGLEQEGRVVPVLTADRDELDLASIGAAVAEPTAWLDEVAYIQSSAALERAKQEAEERAIGILMANGAAPGTAHFADLSAIALPFSPFGTVRIRVRAASLGASHHPHSDLTRTT